MIQERSTPTRAVELPLVITRAQLVTMTEIADKQHVKFESVRQLRAFGVRMSDLEDVLELREALTVRELDGKMNVKAAPTIEIMAIAYRTCEGDMDRLEDVIDLAYDLVQIGSGSARTNLEEGMLIQKAVSLAIFSEQLGVQVL